MVSVGDCFLREDDILPYGLLFTSFPSARVILEWSRPTGFFALLKNDSVGRRSEGSRADCFRLAVVFVGRRGRRPLQGFHITPLSSTDRLGSVGGVLTPSTASGPPPSRGRLWFSGTP